MIHVKGKDRFLSLCDGDKWAGPVDESGNPHFILDGKPQDVSEIAHHLGVKLKGIAKYKQEDKHADMEQTLHSGHTEDAGDGDGESQE